METQILESTGIKTLKLIKSEAEMALKNIHQIDNEITKKSVNLMQVLLPLTVILIGYVIKSFTK